MKTISRAIQEKFDMSLYVHYYKETLDYLKMSYKGLILINFSWCQIEFGRIIERMKELKFKEYIKLRRKLDKINDKLMTKLEECLK